MQKWIKLPYDTTSDFDSVDGKADDAIGELRLPTENHSGAGGAGGLLTQRNS
ncbi:hypothetical protein OS493_017665, partial [Desmophyllum pertusum]